MDGVDDLQAPLDQYHDSIGGDKEELQATAPPLTQVNVTVNDGVVSQQVRNLSRANIADLS
jgi:hypothetical protein